MIPKLRIVVLECAYDVHESKQAGRLFWDMVGLKCGRYKDEYPYGALPVDTTDFVGTHLMVCEELGNGDLTPLVAYRSMTLSRCNTHRLEFPLLSAVKKSGDRQHADVICNALEDCTRRGIDISYESSWAVRQDARSATNKEFGSLLRELVAVMAVHHHDDFDIPESLAGGVVRFKTGKTYTFLGYDRLQKDGAILPVIENYGLYGEQAELWHLTKFSDQARLLAKKYRSLWDQKLILSANPQWATNKAA